MDYTQYKVIPLLTLFPVQCITALFFNSYFLTEVELNLKNIILGRSFTKSISMAAACRTKYGWSKKGGRENEEEDMCPMAGTSMFLGQAETVEALGPAESLQDCWGADVGVRERGIHHSPSFDGAICIITAV